MFALEHGAKMFSFTILQLISQLCHWSNAVLITYIELKRKYPFFVFFFIDNMTFEYE